MNGNSQPRFRLLGSLLGLSVLVVLAQVEGRPPEERADPVPLRRILVPPQRLAQELQRARQGVLVPLPRADFEARVARAAAGASSRATPRLLEARYRAVLVESSLVGSGQWLVHNPGPGPAILPLSALNLAVRRVQLGDTEGILGDLDGKSPGLLLPAAGRVSVELDWSARGEQTPAGIRFELRVPACVLHVLEIELPAAWIPLVSRDGILLSGPFAADGGRRRWRVDCAGRSQLDLLLRSVANPADQAPVVLARLQSRQELAPDVVEAEFEYGLEVLHGSLRQLSWECDAGFHPHEMTAVNLDLESWDFVPGSEPGAKGLLQARLREAVQGTLPPIRIRGRVPLGPGTRWTSPGLRLRGAVPRAENLIVRVPGELQLQDWHAGDFQLLRTVTETDGAQTLHLTTSLVSGGDGGGPQRPQARLATLGPDWQVTQVSWWRLGPPAADLTVVLRVEVLEGRLFRIPIRLPLGWSVKEVELQSSGSSWSWGLAESAEGRPMLQVDLDSPLSPARSGQVTVRLTRSSPEPLASLQPEQSFPEVAPEGGRVLQGILAVSLDPAFRAEVWSPAPLDELPASADVISGLPRPWGEHTPDLLYRSRRSTVAGILRLRPRPARLRCRTVSEVTLADSKVTLRALLQLEPAVGLPRSIDVFATGAGAAPWNWRVLRGNNQLTATHLGASPSLAPSLVGLGASSGWNALALASLPATGRWWRLALAHPLREALTLEGQLDLGHSAERRWDIPLVFVGAADEIKGEVVLRPPRDTPVVVEAVGVEEVPPPDSSAEPDWWRRFRYEDLEARLTLRTSLPDAAIPSAERLEYTQLSVYANLDGEVWNSFRFAVRGWSGSVIPVRLPVGAQLLATRIQGRWLARSPRQVSADHGVQVELPVPEGDQSLEYELIYALNVIAGKTWTRLTSPEPQLSLRPLRSLRTWHLPPDLVPLSGLRPLAVPHAARQEPPSPISEPTSLQIVRSQQLLSEAASALRKQRRRRPGWRLEDAVAYLVVEGLKGQVPLVIDRQALQAVGLGRSTPLINGVEVEDAATEPTGTDDSPVWRPWSALGLIFVQGRSALLLTTTRRAQSWQLPLGIGGRIPDDQQEFVTEAVRYGQDRFGRFVVATDWLRQADTGDSWRSEGLPVIDGPPGDSRIWTEWHCPPGEAGTTVLVVHRNFLRWGTVMTTVLVGILSWLAWLVRPGWGVLSLCGFLGAGIAAWLVLPGPIRPLVGWPLGLAVGLLVASHVTRWITARFPRPVQAASGVLLLLAAGNLTGQSPLEATTVWVVPAPDGQPDKELVLAPPDLLDHLQQLAKRGNPGIRGPVLTGARYEGKLVSNLAEFVAELSVWCPTDEPAILTVPLTGVELQEASLNGAAAHPLALTAPASGYSFRLNQRGPHVLSLRYSVGVSGTGAERELRFGIPEVPRSRLRFAVTAPVPYLATPSARGAAQVVRQSQATQLEADLGRCSTLVVRWQTAPATGMLRTRVREAYYWEVQAPTGRLLALLQYTFSGGSPTALAVDLPPGLEVRRVEASAASAAATPRLKNWTTIGTTRRQLLIEFQAPVTEGVKLFVELIPVFVLSRSVALVLPSPREALLEGESLLAFRLEGIELVSLDAPGLISIDPVEFARRWTALEAEDPGPPTLAFSFHRLEKASPELRLRLRPLSHPGRARHEVTWTVGEMQAEFAARLRWTDSSAERSLVEWELPPAVRVTSLHGPEVRSWSRTDARLQVWLRRSLSEVEMQLQGWMPLNPQPGTAFELPRLKCLTAETHEAIVRLRTAPQLTLRPLQLLNLAAMAVPLGPPLPLTYRSVQSEYGGRFAIQAAGPSQRARVLTVAESEQGRLRLTIHVQLPAGTAEERSWLLRLRHWPADETAVEAAPAVRRREVEQTSESRSWRFDVPAGLGETVTVRLRTSLSPPPETPLILPDAQLLGADPGERWLALVGQEFVPVALRGLRAVPAAPEALQPWPSVAERLRQAGGTIWQVEAAEWGLRLQPVARSRRFQQNELLLIERSAAVLDGLRWTHQASYWLGHPSGTEFRVRMPAAAEVVSVAVNGRETAALRSGDQQLQFPLLGKSRVAIVRLTWVYPPETEPLWQPNLQNPVVENCNLAKVAWTVLIPPGLQAAPPGGEIRPLSRAGVELLRAAALARVVSRIGEHLPPLTGAAPAPDYLAAQEAFLRSCRLAEVALAESGPTEDTGPAGQTLAAWLVELREDNRKAAAAALTEKWLALLERQILTSPTSDDRLLRDKLLAAGDLVLSGPGRPLRWQSPPASLRPYLELTPEERDSFPLPLLAGLLLGMACAAAALVPKERFGWLGRSGPEQLVLVGVLCLLAGWPWIAAALACSGLCWRMLLLVWRVLRRGKPVPAA